MREDLSHLDSLSADEATRRFIGDRLDTSCGACDSDKDVTVERIAWTNDAFTVWFDCGCGYEGCGVLLVEAIEIEWESPDSDDDSGEWDTADDAPADAVPADDTETVECSKCGASVSIEHVNDDGECPDCGKADAAPDSDNPDECDHPADAVEDGICGLCWTELTEAELTERGITADTDTDTAADEE